MLKPIDTSPEAPWKQRYREPVIWSAAIAAQCPERGLVWTNVSGTMQFHTWHPATGELTQITHTAGGHDTVMELSPDGRWVYFLADRHGNEIGHYSRMPSEGGPVQDITPDGEPYSSFTFSLSREGNRFGFAAARKQGFSCHLVDLGPGDTVGTPRLLYSLKTQLSGAFLSADGSRALVMSSEHSGTNEFSLLAFDALTGRRIGELWDGAGTSLEVERLSPVAGDNRLAAVSNRTGIERVLLWNPDTGYRQDLDLDIPGAQAVHDWSPDGGRLVVRGLANAVQTIYLVDLATRETRKLACPPGVHRLFFTPDGRSLLSLWNDAEHNSRVVELDQHTGRVVRTLIEQGTPPRGRPMMSVSFPSSDGKSIQGWLCRPKGKGPFPTIIETHGGPAAVQLNTFHPGAQAWVEHGFAFLTINYHGSVTFGRDFEQSIWFDLGRRETEDLAAAREFLLQEHVARPDALFLTGWSYGGYLTLMGLGKRPDLWTGGMAGIAISDWAMSWEDSADALRGYEEALFGGTPQQHPDRYRSSSPVTYASSFRAPVLIIQGRNDTRTPRRPIEVFEKRMRELGKDITVHWYDTGHAGSETDTGLGIAFQEMMMKFAEQVLARR